MAYILATLMQNLKKRTNHWSETCPLFRGFTAAIALIALNSFPGHLLPQSGHVDLAISQLVLNPNLHVYIVGSPGFPRTTRSTWPRWTPRGHRLPQRTQGIIATRVGTVADITDWV